MKPSVLRFCSLAAIAAAMTACSSDEPAPVAVDNTPAQGITITAQLPVDNVLRPRATGQTALGSGSRIKRVIYAIYDNETMRMLCSNTLEHPEGMPVISFTVDLPVHTMYKLYIWADAGEFSYAPSQEPYHVNLEKHTVSMNTDVLTSGDWTNAGDPAGILRAVEVLQPDDMDAFMYYGEFFPNGDGVETSIKMTRPLMAFGFFSNAWKEIFNASHAYYLGFNFSINRPDTKSAPFADTYDFVNDTITMSDVTMPYVYYVNFTHHPNINSFVTRWSNFDNEYKVLAYQYSFAPRSAENIPFGATSPSLGATFQYSDDKVLRGQSYVQVDLGEPSGWFKPNTVVTLIDDKDNNGGSSVLINNTPVKAVISSGFEGTLQPGV